MKTSSTCFWSSVSCIVASNWSQSSVVAAGLAPAVRLPGVL